jgi:hypothetical protein
MRSRVIPAFQWPPDLRPLLAFAHLPGIIICPEQFCQHINFSKLDFCSTVCSTENQWNRPGANAANHAPQIIATANLAKPDTCAFGGKPIDSPAPPERG